MPTHTDANITESRRLAYLTFSLTAGVGPITLRRATAAAFGVLGLLKFSHTAWAEVDGIGSIKAAQILRDLPRAQKEADQVRDRCASAGIQILTLEDAAYPALMRDLPDAPAVLYVRGNLEPRDLHSVAIVGARQCSFYGRDQASRFASLLAGAGITVVSGGARGVDSAGHEGALRVPQGRTLAVLGCGVDVAYPPENQELFDRLAASGQGAVVSHYPPGTPPNQRHFPERNRVISALSRAVFVIEADERSGSLITARIAADDHNRPVLALPGRVDNPLSSGPHKLLKDGAALITSLEDILDNLSPPPDSSFKTLHHKPLPNELPPSTTPTRTSGPQASLSFSAPTPSTPPRLPQPPAPEPEFTEEITEENTEKVAEKVTEKVAQKVAERTTERTTDRTTERIAQKSIESDGHSSATDTTLSPEQKAILLAMRGQQESQVEFLIDATDLPPATILRELTLLTLKGRISRLDAQTYSLRR